MRSKDIKKEMLEALTKRNPDEFGLGEDLIIDGVDLGKMRSMIGYRGIDLASDIKITEKIVNKVLCYEYLKSDNPTHTLFYIHGGGFYGGSAKVSEYICKYMAKYGDIRVVNIDYTLAPKSKFPNTAKEIYEIIKEYAKICPLKFAIAGDSAGAHIAMNVCQIDKGKYISNIYMYYPVVSLSAKSDWSIKEYNLDESSVNAKNQIIFLRSIMKYVEKFYVGDNIDKNSSMYDLNMISSEEYSTLPKIFIAKAEFDYFNLEINRLISKFNIEYIEYKGLAHGFTELLGYLPEVKDLLEKTVDSFKSNHS